MRREQTFYLLGAALVLAVFGLAACGGGASKLGLGGRGTDNPPADEQPVPGEAPDAPRNVLRLSVPALAALEPGSEFTVSLEAQTVEPLFQASTRLLFDPAQLEPVAADTGDLGQFAVALTRAGRELRMNGQGYVPFSFTCLPDTGGLAPQELKLLEVRFRVLTPLERNGGLRLHNDPGYLQLRAADGRRLSFDLSEEVAAR